MTTSGELKQRAKQFVRRTIGEPYVGKRLKLRSINRVLPGMRLSPERVLDVGSEDATFVYWLADMFPRARVTAIDTDAQSVAACRSARPTAYSSRVEFLVSELIDVQSDSYDLATAFDVLEHIEDDRDAVTQIARALVTGGSLLVHVPRDVWTSSDGRQERVPDSEAWRINPGHVRMGYSPASLSALMESAGLEVITVELWVRRWGTRAHSVYTFFEHPTPLRALSIPFTDLASVLDRRRPEDEGNTVFLHARKPLRSS